MLNIGRMAPDGHDYYLEVVARGVEGSELAAVLAGDHPSTGERLSAHPARKVPGFDLTFRAPKSVRCCGRLPGA